MAFDYSSSFSGINNAIAGFGKRADAERQRQALALLGQDIQSGNYAGAAQKAFALGDADAGIKLATLGKTAQQEAEWMRSNGGALGLGGAPAAAAPVAAAPTSAGDYFGRTASAESSGNDAARNPSSTATGRYQFLQGTWNGLMRDRPDLGLTAEGRTDPQQQERAMRAFTAQNADALKAKGIEPSDRNLYMAHFLGAGAAPNFINAVQQDPTVPATSLVRPEVVAANRGVFLNQDGTPRSAGEVYARMTNRFGDGATAAAAISGGNGAPVQVAQAPATTQADVPAQGAAPAQGFAVPGAAQVDASIANDPRVVNLQRALAGAPERFKPSIQSRLNILVEELKTQRQQNAPTDVQRNHEVARRQGYQGSLMDYQRELRQSTTVNIDQKGEGEYAKTVGKSLGERMDAISKEGDSARQDIAIVGQLRQLGGQIQNLGGGAALQGWLAERGIKVGPNVSEIEAFNALVDKLTPQQRVPGSGASSDLDVRMFKNALPSLIRTPGGNELILSTLEAVANDKAARAMIADRALTGELKPQDAIKELRALPDPMAGLKEARKDNFKSLQQIQQERQPQPQQAPAGAPQQQRPQAAPLSAPTATGPNGQRVIWNGQAWVPMT